MFCVNCGKKIETAWVKCPYCGALINNEDEPIRDMEEIENESSSDNRRKIQHRSFLKFLLLSIITCGIYGIYAFYGYVEDVNEICEGDEKKSPNFIIVLLLSSVTLGIYSIYWWYKQGERIKDAAPRYGVQVRENGAAILVWVLLGATVLPGIGSIVAIYIMFDNMNRIALSYNQEVSAEELERMGKPHPHLIRNVVIAYSVMIAVIIIPIIVFLVYINTGTSEVDEPSKKTVETHVKEDLSKVDLGIYIGKSGDELEQIGLEYDKDDKSYGALDGKVYISCDETSNINMVTIEDAEGKEPNFLGVQIGMNEAEATEKLQKSYPLADKSEEWNVYVDMSTGGTVLCKMAAGTVERITYMVFSEEELQDYVDMSGEYIFPDSNSKYLSEEEVRSVEADQLFIGRNEIFARHGYIFEDEGLKQHFASTTWYQGTVPGEQFNADSVFNDFEKKNVELIKQIENDKSEIITLPLTVINNTGVDIYSFHASLEDVNDWEEDILGDEILYAGESQIVNFYFDSDQLIWDFAMADSQDNTIEFYGMDFTGCSLSGATLTLEYDGTDGYAQLE